MIKRVEADLGSADFDLQYILAKRANASIWAICAHTDSHHTMSLEGKLVNANSRHLWNVKYLVKNLSKLIVINLHEAALKLKQARLERLVCVRTGNDGYGDALLGFTEARNLRCVASAKARSTRERKSS
jgi:hypothetical protein